MTVRRLLLAPVVAYPYLILGLLFLPVVHRAENADAIVNGYLVYVLPGAFAVCLLCAVIAALLFGRSRRETARSATQAVMVVKLAQIPAYLAVFFTGLLLFMFLFVFSPPVILLFWLSDLAAILQTGILGAGAAAAARREGKITSAERAIGTVLQFVFVADVFAAVWFFIRARVTLGRPTAPN